MLRISKPLRSSQITEYFKRDYANASQRAYYTDSGKVEGIWHGRLAAEWGLVGAVEEEHFRLLAAGLHPHTGEELLRRRLPKAEEIRRELEPEWLRDDKAWARFIKEIFTEAAENDGLTALRDNQNLPKPYERIHAETARALGQLDTMVRQSTVAARTEVKAKARYAWDFTVMPPKSISEAILIAGDRALFDDARAALKVALDASQDLVQGRMGGNKAAATSQNWAMAVFEHDTARPTKDKEGNVVLPAPQVHWHGINFNVTRCPDEELRSQDPREIFRAQSYITAIFRAELAYRARARGYEIVRNKEGGKSFELKGYTQEYLRALSPRRQIIEEQMARENVSGAAAAERIARETRDAKIEVDPVTLHRYHREIAAQYGNQGDRIRAEAEARQKQVRPLAPEERLAVALACVDRSTDSLIDRKSVFDRYELIRDSLIQGFGKLRIGDVEQAIDQRVVEGKTLVAVHHYREGKPGERYTTVEERAKEKIILDRALGGRGTVSALAPDPDLSHHVELDGNPQRQKVLEGILQTHDQVVLLQGAAGSRKTSSLAILKSYIEEAGFELRAYAPTGSAAEELRRRGLNAQTLQSLLSQPYPVPNRGHNITTSGHNAVKPTDNSSASRKPVFWVIDETSQVSVRQMHQFLTGGYVGPKDHILLVGDDDPLRHVGQHKSVEAGRVFHMLQDAGVATAKLNKMYRQEDPTLQRVARQIRDGQFESAFSLLESTGHVREFEGADLRHYAIAVAYAESPERTYACAADNRTVRTLNEWIRMMQRTYGHLAPDEAVRARVLIPRQDVTAPELRHTTGYDVGDLVKFAKGNKAVGVVAREYVRVVGINEASQLLTVERHDRSQFSYDPRAVQGGVSTYREEERNFAVGERIQFTQADRGLRVANRETGTIRAIDPVNNTLLVELDAAEGARGRTTTVRLDTHPHLEYSYAMTSYSLQSKTCDRLLLDAGVVDNPLVHQLNQDFTYVACTRPKHQLTIYTDSVAEMREALGQEVVRPSAHSRQEIQEYRDLTPQL